MLAFTRYLQDSMHPYCVLRKDCVKLTPGQEKYSFWKSSVIPYMWRYNGRYPQHLGYKGGIENTESHKKCALKSFR
jgi:hypothetical protein